MPSPYQEFVRKAKARFEENKKKKAHVVGQFQFTAHARYKMNQYGLSEQKVKGIIRSPKRTQKGIAPQTAAVMQPVSPKVAEGKETWKQEIWTMFVKKKRGVAEGLFARETYRIISAWRYPGMSPKGSPIPEEILRELEEGSILEEE